MVKIPCIVLAFYVSIAGAFSQSPDTASYQPRKLKVDEVNFVSSYYRQNGDNAAVTGGIGSEKLTDFATTIDLRISRVDRKRRTNIYSFELGIDTYTSASSDKVDPATISSASSADQRIYPSLAWSRVNPSNGTTVGGNLSVSSEYDYLSIGGGVNVFRNSTDRSRELGLRIQTYQDRVSLIYPIELRSGRKTGKASRETYSATVSCAQIINTRLQVLFLLDFAYQSGFLSLPFNRVYFRDNSADIEHLPSGRLKYPVSARINYFAGDILIVRGFYRYYRDDWGLASHTAEVETVIKITPFVSVSPFYRYYDQSAADYFAGYRAHSGTEEFYTSDYDLSAFASHFPGAGFRIVSPNGIFGIPKFKSVEVRYGHYSRQTGLVSNIVSLRAQFK